MRLRDFLRPEHVILDLRSPTVEDAIDAIDAIERSERVERAHV